MCWAHNQDARRLTLDQSDHDAIVSLLTEMRFVRADLDSIKASISKIDALNSRLVALEQNMEESRVDRRTVWGLMIAVIAAIIIVIGDVLVHVIH